MGVVGNLSRLMSISICSYLVQVLTAPQLTRFWSMRKSAGEVLTVIGLQIPADPVTRTSASIGDPFLTVQGALYVLRSWRHMNGKLQLTFGPAYLG